MTAPAHQPASQGVLAPHFSTKMWCVRFVLLLGDTEQKGAILTDYLIRARKYPADSNDTLIPYITTVALPACLAGWLAGCLAAWLSARLAGWLVGWLAAWLPARLPGCLAGPLKSIAVKCV